MNKIILLVFALFAISRVSAQDNTTGTQWLALSFEQALQEAAKQGKPVFVDCYTKTCGPCMIYKKEIFPIKEIGEYMNATFICIMKDMEEGDGLEIAKKYNVRMYPTFLVVDAQGKELYRVPMLFEPEKELVPMLQLSQQMVETRKKYDNGERNPEFLKDFFSNLKKLNSMEYEKVLSNYLVTEKQNELLEKEYWDVIKNEIHNIELPAFRYALKNRKQYIKKYGDKEVYDKLFGEYTNEFRMARMMGLDYDIRIADAKIFVKDGIKEATPLLWRMEIYDLWNSAKSQKGDIMTYLKRLNKALYRFDIATQMDIANDFGILCEVANKAEKEKMSSMLEKLKSSVKDPSKIKRLEDLQNYFKR